MLITVPSAGAQSLQDLLTAGQKSFVANKSAARLNVLIQNLDANNVYFDQTTTASVAEGIKIDATSGAAALTCYNLSEISLIAETADNDIRVSISEVF